jgi:signal transduction histidine kinase
VKLLPRSLHGRLLALSLLATLVALAVAAVAIGGVLERFVTGTLDGRLGDKLTALAGAIRPDGAIDRVYLARFEAGAERGAVWRIDAPGGSAGALPAIDKAGPPPRPPHHGQPPAAPLRPFEARLADGTPVHGRWDIVPTRKGDAVIAVAVPRWMIARPIRAALWPLAWSLLALGAALTAAALVQLRLGLRPLRTLADAVADIRAGRAESITGDQPAELAPLAAELNALAADNRAALAVARGSAANLAHSLKTPVATLGLSLAEPGRDPDGALAAQVGRIDATIRHHLARARSAVAGGRARAGIAPILDDVAAAVRRLHGDRGIALALEVPPDLVAAVDGHDLAEMAGNLIDNAARHARQGMNVSAGRAGGMIGITVIDDGPGIPADARAQALAAGARLDEGGDGHGFGLAIAAELARLYGGGLTLDDAPGGGLAATLLLPRATD